MTQTREERRESIRKAKARWQKSDIGKLKIAERQKKARYKKLTSPKALSKRKVRHWLSVDQGLDIPMIIPGFIPKGYLQSFDFRTMSYYLHRHYPQYGIAKD